MKHLASGLMMAFIFSGSLSLACDCQKDKGASCGAKGDKVAMAEHCGKDGSSCKCKDCGCSHGSKKDKKEKKAGGDPAAEQSTVK
jgi:hypothetical protein